MPAHRWEGGDRWQVEEKFHEAKKAKEAAAKAARKRNKSDSAAFGQELMGMGTGGEDGVGGYKPGQGEVKKKDAAPVNPYSEAAKKKAAEDKYEEGALEEMKS